MSYVITQKCVGTCATACVDVCPSDCIFGPVRIDELRAVPASERGQRFPTVQLFIDPDLCTDCGACVTECPVEAIHHETAVPPSHLEDIARNRRFFGR